MHLAACTPLVIQGLPAALAGVTSLQDPLHSLLYWVTTVTFRVQLTLCGPPSSHQRRAVRNGGFRLPSSTPASHSRCLGHLPDCKQVPPRSIYFLLGVFFFFPSLDPQRPHFSWIKYEPYSWSHEGGKALAAGVAAAFIAVVADASSLQCREGRGNNPRL